MKKLMALMMALMMLTLPLAGLAEGGSFIDEAVAAGRRVERTTTFAVADGLTGVDEADQMVSELLAALAVTTYWQERDGVQGGLGVVLSGKNVLDVQFALEDSTLYLQSDLLAGNTLAVSADESAAAAENLVKLVASLTGTGTDSLEEARTALESMFTALTNPEALNTSVDVDFEKMMADFASSGAQNGPAFFTETLAERIHDADLTGMPEGGDPAIRALAMEVTAEDIVAFYEMSFDLVKGNEEYMKLLDAIASTNGTEQGGAAMFDDLLAQMREIFPEMMKEPAKVVYYINGDDEVVAATFDVTLEAEETVSMTGDYTRQTGADSTAHHVNVVMDGADGNQVNVTMDYRKTATGFDWDLTATAPESQELTFSVAYDAPVNTATEKQSSGSFTMKVPGNGSPESIGVRFETESSKSGDDAQAQTVVTLSMDGADLFSATTSTVTGAPAAGLAASGALHPAQMSDAELQSFAMDVLNNLQVWATALLQALPTNALLYMMQTN